MPAHPLPLPLPRVAPPAAMPVSGPGPSLAWEFPPPSTPAVASRELPPPDWPAEPSNELRLTTSAIITTNALAAMIHGNVLVDGRLAGAIAPTAVPHRWQKLAPSVSVDRHAAHRLPSNGAPQSAQSDPRL